MPNNIWSMVILFVIGGLLMILELVIPGFGIAGVMGIIALVGGLVVGSTFLTTVQLLIVIFLVLAISIVMLVLLYRSATRNGRVSKFLFLNLKANKEEGYTSSKDLKDMKGKEGISLTALRPAGTGEFDGIKLDVVTDGQFIPKGVKIRIDRVEGFRILVEQIDENAL
ncbi:MAG: hypothetical protein GX352_09060 [Clostridiales bacterium]|nr:hypothetical protein [Clostridiales bacterium]